MADHQAFLAPGEPSSALLQRILATINSYYGVFSHSDTWRLRRHIDHSELGPLRRVFIPEGPGYRYLRIRRAYLAPSVTEQV